MTEKWQEKSFALKLDIQHLKNMARFFCNLIDNTKKPHHVLSNTPNLHQLTALRKPFRWKIIAKCII